MKKETVIYPVILCGGVGKRLWPKSRKSYPKQFAELVSEKSMFQSTIERINWSNSARPTIVTSDSYRFIVTQQLKEIGVSEGKILIEPNQKNTAAAVCAAALALEENGQDALILVMPSDHIIPDESSFHEAVLIGAKEASKGKIVTFGVRPTRAETGYGWLELSERPDAKCSPIPQPLSSFVEKPSESEARKLFEGGGYLWNSGIFLFSIRTIVAAFKTFQPKILEATNQSLQRSKEDLDFTRLEPNEWNKLPNISFDYAIMEKAKNISVVPYGGDWSDLGDWSAVWRQSAKDDDDTVLVGNATKIDCSGSLLHAMSENQELVGIGLKDIIAVSTPDAVLIAHKDRTQDVKRAVELLKDKGATQAENLLRDYRPWGWYETIALGNRFQVKYINVYPGESLSLQSHLHRAEHWIVVAGTAKVVVHDKEKLVTENQSTYIPLGARHRLENPGRVTLTLIEVQTGSYLGEDDITRYEDRYARD